jgi:hypothetical protein
MTTQGSPEEPRPDASDAGHAGPVGETDAMPVGEDRAVPHGDGDPESVADAEPVDRHVGRASLPKEPAPAQLFDGDEMPPPPRVTGFYRIDTGPPKHPSDPILPFVAPRTSRRRRSDWPVLVVALFIAAIVLATCCIAGFALYSSKGPFFQ